MKLFICVLVFTLAASIQAQIDSQDDGLFADYWSNEFEYDDYADDNNKVANDENPEMKDDNDSNKPLDAELLDMKEEPQDVANKDDPFDPFDDYQFEDNRSNDDDKDTVKEAEVDIQNKEPMPDDAPEGILDNIAVSPIEPPKEANDISDDSWEHIFDDIAPLSESKEWVDPLKEEMDDDLPVPAKENESSEESLDTMNEENDNFDDLTADKSLNGDLPEQEPIEHSNLDQVIEETKDILNESNDNFKDDDFDENYNKDEEVLLGNNEDDETPEDVIQDLNNDLDKLLETLDKLNDNDSDLGNNENNSDGINDVNDVQDYEDKYDRPYKEGNILSLRDDLENFDDSNLPDIFAENDANNDKEDTEDSSFEQDLSNLDGNNDEAPIAELQQEQNAESLELNEDTVDDLDYPDDIGKLLSNVDNNLADEDAENPDLRHSYGNDGLVNDQQPINEDAEIISINLDSLVTSTKNENTDKDISNEDITNEDITTTEESTSTMMIDELSSAEYKDLMTQFAFAHSKDLDVNSEHFAKNVAPIHITLSVDEPTIITSPDYPDLYPTDNIVDWIIEGPGTGIEMNITHFEVNGAVGDYLLVKPGGIDEHGTDGIVFSFRLNTERRYRFTNVNRMFVRFESKLGRQFYNGFSFSARMIWSLPELGGEDAPEPEAVLNPPTETLILNLAGLTLGQFEEVKPKFKELIANMAQEYIKDNDIDPGLNTTVEVTQITRIAICNIRWPNYETCVEVTFGVPLHYDEEPEQSRLNAEDLDAMWRTYISKDQFASRLREMGITEYAIPNDRTVLMVWLVISAGVVISMAMLAFALWRFSCFEDYTRMRAFNDTDSIQNEKKNLDLYPTPHQTLPPLYTETDYKWADDKYNDSTRVDMGGFANKSYMRDNLFEFDSDEDVITPHDRRGAPISPRDVYEV